MRDRRQQLRRLLGLCSACRAAGAFSQAHAAILKDSVLHDSEAAAALEDALGPEPWQLQDPATMAAIQRHVHEAAERLLEKLYADHPIEESHVLSTADIDKYDGDISSLTYGEVEFAAFSEVLQIAKDRCDGACKKFYDLGSGAGRAVFTAALNIDFEEFVGIEVLEGLCSVSKAVRQKFDQTVARALNMPRSISFVRGDVLDPAHNWADGDVVFANSTCFDAGLMDGIAARAEQLRPGAVLITFSVAIRSLWFKVVYKKRYTMSWGPATVFIHVKLDEEGYQTRLKEGTEYDNDQDVVYPSAAPDRRGSDADSLKVYFSETSSLHDGTERSDSWAFPTAESEVALEDNEDDDEEAAEAGDDHAVCDEEPDARSWEGPANEQIDEGCLSPSEEALYEQVRRGEQPS